MPELVDRDESRWVRELSSSADLKVAAEALAKLMERHKRLCYALAHEIAGPSSADDVFQETFVRMMVWIRERPGVEVQSFRRLMSAFVRRVSLELGRASRESPLADMPVSSPLFDQIYARELLASVAEPARGVLERTILRGLSSREAAEEMGLTPENVRLIKHRAIRAIREQQASDLRALGEDAV